MRDQLLSLVHRLRRSLLIDLRPNLLHCPQDNLPLCRLPSHQDLQRCSHPLFLVVNQVLHPPPNLHLIRPVNRLVRLRDSQLHSHRHLQVRSLLHDLRVSRQLIRVHNRLVCQPDNLQLLRVVSLLQLLRHSPVGSPRLNQVLSPQRAHLHSHPFVRVLNRRYRHQRSLVAHRHHSQLLVRPPSPLVLLPHNLLRCRAANPQGRRLDSPLSLLLLNLRHTPPANLLRHLPVNPLHYRPHSRVVPLVLNLLRNQVNNRPLRQPHSLRRLRRANHQHDLLVNQVVLRPHSLVVNQQHCPVLNRRQVQVHSLRHAPVINLHRRLLLSPVLCHRANLPHSRAHNRQNPHRDNRVQHLRRNHRIALPLNLPAFLHHNHQPLQQCSHRARLRRSRVHHPVHSRPHYLLHSPVEVPQCSPVLSHLVSLALNHQARQQTSRLQYPPHSHQRYQLCNQVDVQVHSHHLRQHPNHPGGRVRNHLLDHQLSRQTVPLHSPP